MAALDAARTSRPASRKLENSYYSRQFEVHLMSAQTASLGHDALHACNHPCAGALAFKDTILAVAAPPLRAAAL
jgi:hypothetical protein